MSPLIVVPAFAFAVACLLRGLCMVFEWLADRPPRKIRKAMKEGTWGH